ENVPGFRIAALWPKVTQQPGPQRLGLADVDQFAPRIDHAIDAGSLGTLLANPHAQLRRPPALHQVQGRQAGGRVQASRAETRKRTATEQGSHNGSREIRNRKSETNNSTRISDF